MMDNSARALSFSATAVLATSLVAGVAHAQAAASTDAAPGSEATTGWDGSFFVRSQDGAFEFRPVGILQIDFRAHRNERQITSDQTLATTFDIRRLRLGFEGFLFRDIGYTFEANIDESEAELIFAYLNLGYLPWANLRIGQFKEPFSYEVLYPEKYLDFVERSHIATSVAPAESIGVMVHNLGQPYEGFLEYGLGVFNANGTRLADASNNHLEFAGRVGLLPFARDPFWLNHLEIAANIAYVHEQQREFGFRPRTSEQFEIFPLLPVDGMRLRWGADLQWHHGPVSLKGEYIRAEEERNGLENLVTSGGHVDATWVITGQEKLLVMDAGVEVAARYEEMRIDAGEAFTVSGYVDQAGAGISITDELARSLTMGLNYYLNHNIKFQINYQHTWLADPLLTPTSRVAQDVLGPGSTSIPKLLARVQLFI